MDATVQRQPAARVAWRPQPGPQWFLLSCPVEDVFFGGSRGGGKTDGLLGDWLGHAGRYGKNARGIFLRRTYPEIEEVERRASELFPPTRAQLNVAKRTWAWENGATLRMRYLQREDDADHLQGHQYSWIGVDEITQWPTLAGLDKIRATLRSAAGIPCTFRSSGNPGGPGHNLVKSRYIDPAPPGTPFYDEEAKTWRVFIPSRLEHNLLLMRNDPLYWQRIEASAAGRPDLLKAWRFGEWDIVAGGMFDDLWSPSHHVIEPFPIPTSWKIARAFDWGSSHPFSVGWWATSDGTQAPNGRYYPRGSVFRIGEWYGWNTKPNEGLKMLAVEVGRGILRREHEMGIHERVQPGPADAAMWAAENGVCIADDMARGGARFVPSDKSPGSRKAGAEAVRKYFKAARQIPQEGPGMCIFSTCRQFIRTVPVLPRDPKDLDDVSTDAEDHVYDETRYFLMTPTHALTTAKLRGI